LRVCLIRGDLRRSCHTRPLSRRSGAA
jgi:hypothetical protein